MKLKNLILLITSIFIASLVLVGCSSNEVSSPKPEDKATETKTQEEEKVEVETTEEEPTTRTYTHLMGETEIPVEPKRIVTTQYLGEMLALGVKPVGAMEYHLDDHFFDGQVEGIESIGNEVNLESVLALEPDLIIASNFNEKIYEELSKIAPTVMIGWMDHDVYGHLEVVADVIGKQEEAKQWLKEYEEKSKAAEAKVKAKIGEETVAIYRIRNGGFQAYGPRNTGHVFYNSMNIKAPALIQAEIEKDEKYHSTEISLEVLPEYAADHIFVMVEDNDETKAQFEAIEGSSIWSNLPAVKNGNLYFIEKDKWLPYDPTSIAGQLDEAVRVLTE